MEELCAKCGEIIPEGFMECLNCEPEIEEHVSYSSGECFKCKKTRIQVQITMHEPLMGAKYRQLSKKYNLIVPLCWDCHDDVQTDPTQEYNRYLQRLMQEKFIREQPQLSFMKIFGRNYL